MALDHAIVEGVVYFIQAEHGGPVKIGYCRADRSITAYRNTLQAGNPFHLIIRAKLRNCGPTTKKVIHQMLAAELFDNDWIASSDRVLKLMSWAKRNPASTHDEVVLKIEELTPVRSNSKIMTEKRMREIVDIARAEAELQRRRAKLDTDA